MNFLDKLRKALAFPGHRSPQINTSAYYPSTSKERKAEALANRRLVHTSVDFIQHDATMREQAAKLGIVLPSHYATKPVTRSNGNNYLKAEADRIAKLNGWNNKQRRKLRSAMKARAAELRAA